MKTFIEWLRSTRNTSLKDAIRANKIAMFKSFANRYAGTCDYDLNGLWLTAASRVEVMMMDDT